MGRINVGQEIYLDFLQPYDTLPELEGALRLGLSRNISDEDILPPEMPIPGRLRIFEVLRVLDGAEYPMVFCREDLLLDHVLPTFGKTSPAEEDDVLIIRSRHWLRLQAFLLLKQQPQGAGFQSLHGIVSDIDRKCDREDLDVLEVYLLRIYACWLMITFPQAFEGHDEDEVGPAISTKKHILAQSQGSSPIIAGVTYRKLRERHGYHVNEILPKFPRETERSLITFAAKSYFDSSV